MKTKSILRLSWLGAALLAFAGCATTRQPPAPDTVSVLVNLPPTTSVVYSDRIAEIFTDEIRHAFLQQGIQRPVENILYEGDPEATSNLLRIHLHRWRFDRLGNIECTFQAELQTPRGTRDLGVYSGMSPAISRRSGPWGLADSFDEAAQDALDDLARIIAKSELLPARTTPAHPLGTEPKTHV